MNWILPEEGYQVSRIEHVKETLQVTKKKIIERKYFVQYFLFRVRGGIIYNSIIKHNYLIYKKMGLKLSRGSDSLNSASGNLQKVFIQVHFKTRALNKGILFTDGFNDTMSTNYCCKDAVWPKISHFEQRICLIKTHSCRLSWFQTHKNMLISLYTIFPASNIF